MRISKSNLVILIISVIAVFLVVAVNNMPMAIELTPGVNMAFWIGMIVIGTVTLLYFQGKGSSQAIRKIEEDEEKSNEISLGELTHVSLPRSEFTEPKAFLEDHLNKKISVSQVVPALFKIVKFLQEEVTKARQADEKRVKAGYDRFGLNLPSGGASHAQMLDAVFKAAEKNLNDKVAEKELEVAKLRAELTAMSAKVTEAQKIIATKDDVIAKATMLIHPATDGWDNFKTTYALEPGVQRGLAVVAVKEPVFKPTFEVISAESLNLIEQAKISTVLAMAAIPLIEPTTPALPALEKVFGTTSIYTLGKELADKVTPALRDKSDPGFSEAMDTYVTAIDAAVGHLNTTT